MGAKASPAQTIARKSRLLYPYSHRRHDLGTRICSEPEAGTLTDLKTSRRDNGFATAPCVLSYRTVRESQIGLLTFCVQAWLAIHWRGTDVAADTTCVGDNDPL